MIFCCTTYVNQQIRLTNILHPRSSQPLYLSNAGTAARFLTTLVTLVGTTEESRRSGAAAGIAGEEKEGGKAPPQTVLEGSVRMNVRPQVRNRNRKRHHPVCVCV